VPTIGGETRFHPAYNGNCLVNAFAAGLVEADSIFYSAASGVGMPVVYLGAKTGRDGVGGATMASAEFDDTIEEKRPTVQVGDPFTEKRLLEACLELMADGRGDLDPGHGRRGPDLFGGGDGRQGRAWHPTDARPRAAARRRDDRLRDDAVGKPGTHAHGAAPRKEAEARAVFEKWDLDFAIVGETIPEDRFVIVHGNETVKADLPLSKLSSEAPEYDRPWVESPPPRRWPRCRRSIPSTR
jgi:phosphoribosylformylglycinamidine (FGAM) synthase-like enzyme